MAIVDIAGQMVYPRSPCVYNANPAFTTGPTIDAASEAVGMIVSAPKTGNIRKVLWAMRTSTTGATLDVRLEQLTSGFPNGTLFGANTNGSQVVADTDDNVFFSTQLTADAAVVKGQLIGVRIVNPAVSPGNMLLAAMSDDYQLGIPFLALYTGTWATLSGAPAIAFEYDDGTIALSPGCYPPMTSLTSSSIGTASTPDVVGVLFKVPFPCRIVGAWTWADIDAACAIRLVTTAYNQGAGTGILGSITVGADDDATGSPYVALRLFATPIDLAADTYYRLIIEPTSASTVTVYDLDAPSLAALNAWNGPDWVLTTAKDPTGDGDWTNYNSGTFRYPLMGLLIGGFDAGGGGGGLLTHPGMSGMRG